MEDIHKYKYLKYKTKYLNLIIHMNGGEVRNVSWTALKTQILNAANKEAIKTQLKNQLNIQNRNELIVNKLAIYNTNYTVTYTNYRVTNVSNDQIMEFINTI